MTSLGMKPQIGVENNYTKFNVPDCTFDHLPIIYIRNSNIFYSPKT